MAPLAQSLIFFQKGDCRQGIGISSPGPRIGPVTVTAPKPCTRKPAPGSVKTECPPAAHPRAWLTSARHRHSTPACPWEGCKAFCQESQSPQTQTSRVSGPHALYSLTGTKNAKAALKASLDTLPGASDLCRLQRAPSVTQQNRVPRSSRETSPLEGKNFSVSSQQDRFKASSDQKILSPSTCPPTRLSGRPT